MRYFRRITLVLSFSLVLIAGAVQANPRTREAEPVNKTISRIIDYVRRLIMPSPHDEITGTKP
ncbi:MAG TPA: hypothetical protein VGR02_11585 [Thermoanaerobaculia bacterium]|jgi:hypothetical protein|nr:hypothetical protein [Thermoanaerobaculia bacterium]